MSDSNKKTFEKITEQEIAANGIQALANRPNKSSQYGQSGLSATELKKWFDNLASLIARKVNGIANALERKDAPNYIAMPEEWKGYESLGDVLSAMLDGTLIEDKLKIKISEALAQNDLEFNDTVTLQLCLEKLFSELFNKFDDLEDDIEDGSLAKQLKINNTELNSLGKKYLNDIIDKILQLIKRKAELTLKDLLIVPDQPIDYVYGDGGTPMLDFETGEFRTTFEPRAAINSNFADERYAREIRTSYNNQDGTLTVSLWGKNESGATKEISNQTIDLPLESSIIQIEEDEKDGKLYLKLTLANGNTTEVELDDLFKLKSEWDFIIDTHNKLGEISNMYGNVLIQCDIPSESGDVITVPEAVKYLKIDIPYTSDFILDGITGHDECVLEGNNCMLGYYCDISHFKEVRNASVPSATIRNCGFVYNCTALNFESCKYVELSNVIDTSASSGMDASFKNCAHICHVSYERDDVLNIVNCDIVENIATTELDYYSPSVIITNAKTVDMVSGFASATYENCKYVNPQTCQDYVVQQNAVGKVQVLTADGSFEAIDISEIVDSINGIEEELTMINEGGIE